MGMNADYLRFLCASAKAGAKLGSVITLGRQFFLQPPDCYAVMGEYGWSAGAMAERPAPPYADDVFRYLGAESVDSIDVSDYEKASIVYDMNEPVPVSLHDRFDFLFDGGTLEHVFDIAVAVRNCKQMVKPGGHLLLTLVANNFVGHGFYQFSPEFIFSAFDRAQGFEVLDAVLTVGMTPRKTRWYRIIDPCQAGSRVCLMNRKPTMMLALVKKTGPVLDAVRPQQSDYVTTWTDQKTSYDAPTPARSRLRKIKDALPHSVSDPLVQLYRWFYVETVRNRSFYIPVRKEGYQIGK